MTGLLESMARCRDAGAHLQTRLYDWLGMPVAVRATSEFFESPDAITLYAWHQMSRATAAGVPGVGCVRAEIILGSARDARDLAEAVRASLPLRFTRTDVTGYGDQQLHVRVYWDHSMVAVDHGRQTVVGLCSSKVPASALIMTGLMPYAAERLTGLGVYCFHAAVVGLGGRAAAFVAPAGTGKTTLAMTLARMGCDLLTDDLLISEFDGRDAPVVHAHPVVNVSRSMLDSWFPDLLLAVFPRPGDEPRDLKRRMWTAELVGRAAVGHQRLDRVFLLERGASDCTVQPVGRKEALLRLLHAKWYGLPDRETLTRHYAFCQYIVDNCTVSRVVASSPHATALRVLAELELR